MERVVKSLGDSVGVYVVCGSVAFLSWGVLDAELAPFFFWAVAVLLVVWTALSLAGLDQLVYRLDALRVFLERVSAETAKGSEQPPDWPLVRGLVKRQPDGTIEFSSSVFELDVHYVLHHLRPAHRVAVEHSPALFTALGILFTFFGLIYGIKDLSIGEDASKLAAGMKTLLPSVSVAFQSSLAGIFLSFVTLVQSRRKLARASQVCGDIREHANYLDEKNSAAYALRQLNVKSAAIEHTAAATHNEVLRLVDVSEEQNVKLGTLGSDIAAALDGVLQRAVGEPMAQLAQSFNAFSTGELDTHSAALEQVLGGFMSQFEQTMGDRFDELQTVLDHTLEWHQQSKSSLDALSASLADTALAWERERQVQVELVEARMTMYARHERQISEAIAGAEKLTTKLHEVGGNMATLAPFWQDTAATLGTMTRELRESAVGLGEAQEGVRGIADDLRVGVDSALGAVRESVTELERALDLAPERYQALADEIRREMDAGLQKTFSQFDTATADVVSRLGGSYLTMQQSLDDFGQALTGLDRRLESAATTQIFQPIKPAE